MIKKFFITGTDTNVGKTFVAIILLKKAEKFGYKTAAYKPISSGKIKIGNQFINKDTVLLSKNISVKLTHQEINPISFFEHFPPNILSEIHKKKICLDDLSSGLNNIIKKSNWIIIEGAGGWYTPLSKKNKISDWVKKEQINVILVVGIKLGCINHAILTEQAIIKEKIICVGWVANNIFPEDKYSLYYIKTLLHHIKAPFLGNIPYIKNKNNIDYNNFTIYLPEKN